MTAARCIMAVKVICINNILKARYQRGLNFIVDFPTLDNLSRYKYGLHSKDATVHLQEITLVSNRLKHLLSEVFEAPHIMDRLYRKIVVFRH